MLRALTTLLAGVALVVATHGHQRPKSPPWRVHDAPFRVDVVRDGHVVTSFGGSAAPLAYTTPDGVEHDLTRVTRTSVRGGVTTLTLAATGAHTAARISLRATASGVRVTYAAPARAAATALRFELAAPTTAHFLGTGERIRWVDMRGTVVPLKVYNACSSSAPTSLFASTAGFGGWTESTSVGRIAFPGAVDDSTFACDLGSPPCSVGPPTSAVRVCLKAGSATFDVVAGSIPQVIRAHAVATGFPRRPWLPQFALIKWRDEVSGEQELLDDVHELQSRNLPLGWLLLDNPWEQGAHQGCYGSLTFDSTRFPDPRSMIRTIHRSGVRFMLWISPQIARGSCPEPSLPDGYLTGNDEIFVRDLTNPAEFKEFTSDLRRLVSLGVDGFKGDRGDEVNLEPDRLVGGPGLVEQNRYTRLYANAVADAFASSGKAGYGTLFRTFGYGAGPLLPGVVGPDEPQTWTGLQGAIRAAQTEGLTGAVVWGSDVGGYSGGTLTAELFARWSQFAALTPIFEVGGAGENATFWQFGAATIAAFRAAATLHYELVPYLYDLARAATTTGLPVVRPLGLTWPADARAWGSNLEFTVGDALLAAPLVHSGATSRVYLPRGGWLDFFTGMRVRGGGTVARTSTSVTFPLYVRAGSALPFDARTPNVWPAPWRTNDLLRAGRQGWLVAPARGASETAHDRSTTLRAATDGRGLTTIRLAHPLREQQILVLAGEAICRVALDGRRLPRATPSALVTRGDGWAPDPTRRAAYMVKTTGAGTTPLTLTPCS